MDRHIDLILSDKPTVGRNDLPGIIWPTQIPGLTDATMARYDAREEVSSAVQRVDLMYDGLTRTYLDRLSKLWRVSMLVYRENPLWMLSGHRGISCRSGRRVGNEDSTSVILPLWTQRFVDNLSSLILHPFFSSRQNGAFLRLALQFAVAYRSRDNRVWDISALLSEAGVQCPALTMLSDEMARHGATRSVGGAGGRIWNISAISVYERLSSICGLLDSGMLSAEARFLLQLGTGRRRETASIIRRDALPANEPRHVFHVATDDLEFIYRAADSVASNPPSKNEASRACTYYCGRSRIPQIHRTNMKPHFMNAYRHELYLLQTFRDRMAGLSLETPPTTMPPGAMQQVPMQFSIQDPPPPQQQPVPLNAMSHGQMGFQGQYQARSWPSQITLGAGDHGAHFGAPHTSRPPPRSIPIRDEDASTSSLEHHPDAFLPSQSTASGGAPEDIPAYTPEDQTLVLLLQNTRDVGEYTDSEPTMFVSD